jgi:two-component system, response regulator FlrC
MRLLILGPLDGHFSTAGKIALNRGATVAHADDVEHGLSALRSGQGADLLMMDVKLDIARMIDSLKQERIFVPIVACGIGNDADAAVRAIKAGAKEYIPLPPDAELIAAVLQAVSTDSHALIYRDPAMERVVRLAEQVAPSEASILITGESGTGKEVLARYVHRKSKRAKAPFISVNCAAIPENLLESELFGHEKGAFTGAIARRIGKFEEAHGGTLLLDEISEMHPRLQAKLLRAIQEREIDRVGGTQPIKVDIRLIATSNRDLEAEARNGNFREDLYFRLNVINVHVLPLRERPRDIDMLADFFAKKYAEMNALPQRRLSPALREKLTHHAWRGNVRELENAMHRAVLLGHGEEIGPDAIALPNAKPTAAASAVETDANGARAGLVGRTVADVERDLILETLQHCLGNRTHAANILGISIRTLRNKLQLYRQEGVAVPLPSEPERVPA